MDILALMTFFIITLLFALFVAAILKFLVFRFVQPWGLGAMPYAGWVIIVIVIMFALQFAGVNVAGAYSAFFGWLSEVVKEVGI